MPASRQQPHVWVLAAGLLTSPSEAFCGPAVASLSQARWVSTAGNSQIMQPRKRSWVQMSMASEGAPVSRRSLLGSIASFSAGIAAAAGLASAAETAQQQDIAALLCDDAISHLKDPASGKEIYLIGTAHVSDLSARLVERAIRAVKPDVVMVELDKKRFTRFGPSKPDSDTTAAAPKKQPNTLQQMLNVLLDKEVPLTEKLPGLGSVLVGRAIGQLYQQTDKLGFVAGQEMEVAIREAGQCGAKLLLGDQDVDVTLRRLTRALASVGDLGNIEVPDNLASLGQADFSNKDSFSAAVEMIKQRENVRELTKSLKQSARPIYDAMLGERDAYMANSLKQCEGKTFVAVVGMAHMDGIEANLQYKKLPCGSQQAKGQGVFGWGRSV